MKTEPGYESLAGVLQRALDQAQTGKGAERHANSLPFDKQPMQTIAAQVGVGFLTGQAIKKTQEGQTLPAGRDVAELLGAINYLAGAVIFLESQPVPAADNDNIPDVPPGFIAWNPKAGGSIPDMVDAVMLRDGTFRTCGRLVDSDWSVAPIHPKQIVGYKPHG